MPPWKGERGSEARLMLTTGGPAATEVWRWTLEPGEEYPSHPHQAGVTETVSVTAGEMVLVVDGTEYSVAAGQTATFDADTTHTYRGTDIQAPRSAPLPAHRVGVRTRAVNLYGDWDQAAWTVFPPRRSFGADRAPARPERPASSSGWTGGRVTRG